MYLSAKKHLGKYQNEEEADKVRKLFPEMYKSGNLDYIEVSFEVGYWRKANQIHKWFVDNCQNEVDECQRSYVSREQLRELLKICKIILNSSKKDKVKKAEEMLPVQRGFFFGGVEYDEYYFMDLEETIKIMERCLTLPEEWEFEYHSSW